MPGTVAPGLVGGLRTGGAPLGFGRGPPRLPVVEVILLSGLAIVEPLHAGILLLVEMRPSRVPAVIGALVASGLSLVEVRLSRVPAVIGALVASGLSLVEVCLSRVPAVVLPFLPGLLAIIESAVATGLPLLEPLGLRGLPFLEPPPAGAQPGVKSGLGGRVHVAANPLDPLLVGLAQTLGELVKLGQTLGVAQLLRKVAELPQPGLPVPVGPLGPPGPPEQLLILGRHAGPGARIGTSGARGCGRRCAHEDRSRHGKTNDIHWLLLTLEKTDGPPSVARCTLENGFAGVKRNHPSGLPSFARPAAHTDHGRAIRRRLSG